MCEGARQEASEQEPAGVIWHGGSRRGGGKQDEGAGGSPTELPNEPQVSQQNPKPCTLGPKPCTWRRPRRLAHGGPGGAHPLEGPPTWGGSPIPLSTEPQVSYPLCVPLAEHSGKHQVTELT